METGKYALSPSGGFGFCGGQTGKNQCFYGGVDRDVVINLTTRDLAFATDYCGVKSGRDVDKFKEMKLTPMPAEKISAPLIKESPVNIECKVTQTIPLGTHDMFLAEVVAVHADEAYMDEKGKFSFTKAQPLVYSHGTYFTLGKEIGTFGYSVRKKSTGKKKKN